MFENGIFDAVLCTRFFFFSGLSVKFNNAFLKNSYANKKIQRERKIYYNKNVIKYNPLLFFFKET